MCVCARLLAKALIPSQSILNMMREQEEGKWLFEQKKTIFYGTYHKLSRRLLQQPCILLNGT